MPNVVKHDLVAEDVPKVDGPVEQLTRVVGFFRKGNSLALPRAFASGFFDPEHRGFLVTAAHNLFSAHGPASSVKVKGYTAGGQYFVLWGRQFAVLADYADAGVGADIAVVWLKHDPIVDAPASLKRPKDGHLSAFLRAYNSDASFDLHEPELSTFKAVATADRLIYQSASGTRQMSGAPVIRAGKGGHVVGVHNGIDDGHYVATRIDLHLLDDLYSTF